MVTLPTRLIGALMLDAYRYRGRHRIHHVPVVHRLAIPALATGIAIAATGSSLVIAAAPAAAPQATVTFAAPPRDPDVLPVPLLPQRAAVVPESHPVATPTSTPLPTRIRSGPPVVGLPPRMCADYRSLETAQAALDADPDLAAMLDSDGDGRPCELQWPRPAPVSPTTATPTPEARSIETEPDTGGKDCSTELDNTRPHVAQAGHHLADRFGIPLSSIGGRAGRAGVSDHPTGHALDFMVGRGTGDELADYALDHSTELAIKYVIWRQRINHGNGWEMMEDRGDDTANHYDHVHLSFEAEPGSGLPC